MAPHLTDAEKTRILELAAEHFTPDQICAKIGKRRGKKLDPPDVGTIRRYLRGKTHRPGEETRGRSPVLSRGNVVHMDKVRKSTIKKVMTSDNPRYVPWGEIIKKSRVGKHTSLLYPLLTKRDKAASIGYLGPSGKVRYPFVSKVCFSIH